MADSPTNEHSNDNGESQSVPKAEESTNIPSPSPTSDDDAAAAAAIPSASQGDQEDNVVPSSTPDQEDPWDVPLLASKSKESDVSESNKDKDNKEESLQPGDHVTRWEMLPIAWPIQVHGIVLNVHEGTVVLVDFGLSAAPANKEKNKKDNNNSNNNNNSSNAGTENEGEGETPKPDVPKTKQLEQAMRNFRIGGMKREKNRLNINVLTDPKDIAKWKRVNYERNWFGGNAGSSANNKDGGEGSNPSPTKAQRTKDWLKNMASSVKEKSSRSGFASWRRGSAAAAKATDGTAAAAASAANGGDAQTVETTKDQDDATAATAAAADTPDLAPSASQDSNLSATATATAAELKASSSLVSEGSAASNDFAGHSMNPKMKELLQKKQEQNPPKTMNPAMAKILRKKEEESVYEKKRKESLAKLPKADPAKLVLARTHWLLEHGESVLPPYHAFSSNSECLAVFCKTGKWNTLQADVFLHSTAIGNAKTMGATTIAVAASAPLLAPAVAVAGIGAVAAPWFYLNKHKNKAVDSQQKLTDAFWAQAEPEVFVACIQAWSQDLLGLTTMNVAAANKTEGVGDDGDVVETTTTDASSAIGDNATAATSTTNETIDENEKSGGQDAAPAVQQL